MKMKLYTVTDHDSHWPVGCASVVLAANKGHARRLLDKELNNCGLSPYKQVPYNLQEVDLSKSQAIVLCDGEY